MVIIMFDSMVFLIARGGQTETGGGEVTETTTKRMVFAELQSVRQSEFYQAAANGLKPELQFLLPDYAEYRNEKELEFDGVTYKILRTYKKGLMLEVVCYGGVNIGRI